MIIRKNNKKDGEGITLEGLFKELNDLFKGDEFVARKDDPKFSDIKSMLKSLVDGEAEFSEEEETPESIELTDEELAGGYVTYDRVRDAVLYNDAITVNDAHGKKIPTIAFLAAPQMMEGVVETIREMNAPTIVALEEGLITKAFIAKGIVREEMLMKYKNIPALMFDEDGGMCRLSINRKDGYDFIFGENGVTRFIIFDEAVCPDTIPMDIVSDDKKWGKRMSKEIPQLIEKRIEESKSEEKKTPLCNLPESCVFNESPYTETKKPIIADIMKDFAEAKNKGKVGDDTFVEFMKPENKEAVTKAVEKAIYEDEVDDFTDEDANPDCFRCIAEYMTKEGVDSIHFYTDEEGLIHCDVQIKTVYKVELDK